MEESSKFKYVPPDFFKTFEFSELVTDEEEEEESEEEVDDDATSKNSQPKSAVTAVNDVNAMILAELKGIKSSQEISTSRLQRMESKVGRIQSPGKLPEVATSRAIPKLEQPSSTTKKKLLPLLSPEPVSIDTGTGDAYSDITTFHCFGEVYGQYWKELDGITLNPSVSKKSPKDPKFCLTAMAEKFNIDTSDMTAPVLKEHVCHMATVRHLFKNFNEELSSKKFKDPGLVPLKKLKWGDRDE